MIIKLKRLREQFERAFIIAGHAKEAEFHTRDLPSIVTYLPGPSHIRGLPRDADVYLAGTYNSRPDISVMLHLLKQSGITPKPISEYKPKPLKKG